MVIKIINPPKDFTKQHLLDLGLTGSLDVIMMEKGPKTLHNAWDPNKEMAIVLKELAYDYRRNQRTKIGEAVNRYLVNKCLCKLFNAWTWRPTNDNDLYGGMFVPFSDIDPDDSRWKKKFTQGLNRKVPTNVVGPLHTISTFRRVDEFTDIVFEVERFNNSVSVRRLADLAALKAGDDEEPIVPGARVARGNNEIDDDDYGDRHHDGSSADDFDANGNDGNTDFADGLSPVTSRMDRITPIIDYRPHRPQGRKWKCLEGGFFHWWGDLDPDEFVNYLNENYLVPTRYNRDDHGLDMVGTVLYDQLGLLLVLINGDALICDFSGDELNKLYPGMVPFMMEAFGFQSETQAKEIFADCVRQMKTIQYDTTGEFVEFLRMTADYQQLLYTYINSVVDSNCLRIELTGTARHREILPVLHGITEQVWVEGQPFIIERRNDNDARTTDGVGVGNTGLGDPNVADGARGSGAGDESSTDGDHGLDGEDNEDDTYIANETINLVSDVSDEELSYDDNFIGQSKNVKQRATATGQGKGASATSTGNEQHKRSIASLKAKELEIKRLESVLEKRGELLIVPDDSEFDIFFIDYHDDDISEVLYRKESLIKILKSRVDGIY